MQIKDLIHHLFPGDYVYASGDGTTNPYLYAAPPIHPLAWHDLETGIVSLTYTQVPLGPLIDELVATLEGEPELVRLWEILATTQWDSKHLDTAHSTDHLIADDHFNELALREIDAGLCMKTMMDIFMLQSEVRGRLGTKFICLEEVHTQLTMEDPPTAVGPDGNPVHLNLLRIIVVQPKDGILKSVYLNPAIHFSGKTQGTMKSMTVSLTKAKKVTGLTRHDFDTNVSSTEVMRRVAGISLTPTEIKSTKLRINQLYYGISMAYYVILKDSIGVAQIASPATTLKPFELIKETIPFEDAGLTEIFGDSLQKMMNVGKLGDRNKFFEEKRVRAVKKNITHWKVGIYQLIDTLFSENNVVISPKWMDDFNLLYPAIESQNKIMPMASAYGLMYLSEKLYGHTDKGLPNHIKLIWLLNILYPKEVFINIMGIKDSMTNLNKRISTALGVSVVGPNGSTPSLAQLYPKGVKEFKDKVRVTSVVWYNQPAIWHVVVDSYLELLLESF